MLTSQPQERMTVLAPPITTILEFRLAQHATIPARIVQEETQLVIVLRVLEDQTDWHLQMAQINVFVIRVSTMVEVRTALRVTTLAQPATDQITITAKLVLLPRIEAQLLLLEYVLA